MVGITSRSQVEDLDANTSFLTSDSVSDWNSMNVTHVELDDKDISEGPCGTLSRSFLSWTILSVKNCKKSLAKDTSLVWNGSGLSLDLPSRSDVTAYRLLIFPSACSTLSDPDQVYLKCVYLFPFHQFILNIARHNTIVITYFLVIYKCWFGWTARVSMKSHIS